MVELGSISYEELYVRKNLEEGENGRTRFSFGRSPSHSGVTLLYFTCGTIYVGIWRQERMVELGAFPQCSGVILLYFI